MSIIYYGYENAIAPKKISNWINITGEPAFFSFADDRVKAFNGNLLGKYKVVMLDEALRIYPNAHIWITYTNIANAKAAAEKVLEKVSHENIHFLETDLEYRKGCERLGRSFHYKNGTHLWMCTVGNREKPSVKVSDDLHEKIMQWQAFSQKLIYANQIDSPNKCFGCPLNKWGFYRRTVSCRNLRFLQDLNKDVCNFKCAYCDSGVSNKWAKLKQTGGHTTYDIIKAFADIPDYANAGSDFVVTFANGEPLANVHFDEIADILLKCKWKMDVFSNLSLYREKFAQLLQAGQVIRVICSLDAGTRETFKRIKQNDRFHYVIDNLKKYPLDKTKIQLKYIFLEGINDNTLDIDGFYEIARSCRADIILSTDKKTNATPFTQNTNRRVH